MCNRCDKSMVVKPWKAWTSGVVIVIITVATLVFTQVFLYGQYTQSVTNHIEEDLTHKEMVEEFVTQREFQMLIKSMDEKLKTITDFITKGK